jgi:hypothetical protein
VALGRALYSKLCRTCGGKLLHVVPSRFDPFSSGKSMYVAYVAYMWLSVAWPIYPNTNMQAALIDRGPNALRCVEFR